MSLRLLLQKWTARDHQPHGGFDKLHHVSSLGSSSLVETKGGGRKGYWEPRVRIVLSKGEPGGKTEN